jgi:hemoglobin
MRTRWALAVALACGWAAASAQDKKPDPKDADPPPPGITLAELDRRAAQAAYDATVQGTELFNKGSHEDCYWLYHGTLTALIPVLEHRTVLTTSIKLRLNEGKKKPSVADGAFVLREALDDVQNLARGRNAAVPPAGKPNDPAEPAKPVAVLWERLGGEKAVRALVHDFVAAAAKDPKVNLTRNGKYKLDDKALARMEQLTVEMLSDFTGGPLKYTGIKNLKQAHAGMGITGEEFDALVGYLIVALRKHKVEPLAGAEVLRIVGATRPVIVEK